MNKLTEREKEQIKDLIFGMSIEEREVVKEALNEIDASKDKRGTTNE